KKIRVFRVHPCPIIKSVGELVLRELVARKFQQAGRGRVRTSADGKQKKIRVFRVHPCPIIKSVGGAS
ncbi:MAG: hypothetical protein DRI56_12225, partial [Chloroflexota bacterium]